MAARPLNVAPMGPVSLPDTGLGRGWEPSVIMGVTVLLFTFGLVTLYSASQVQALREGVPDYYYVLKQTTGGALGLGGMVLLSRVPYGWWRPLAWPFLVVTWILLMVLVLPGTEQIAPRINGARRWIQLGITIQPSELAKMALVIWTAALAVKKQPHFKSLRRGIGPFFVVWAVVLLPIAAEPDFSTACLIGLLAGMVLFAAGARIGHFVFLGLLLLPVVRWQLGGPDLPGMLVPRGAACSRWRAAPRQADAGRASVHPHVAELEQDLGHCVPTHLLRDGGART